MYDPILDPEMTRTGAAKSVFTNADKAAKYDAIRSEIDFREKAAPLMAQAERTGAEKLMMEIAAQREAQLMQPQQPAGLAELFKQEQQRYV